MTGGLSPVIIAPIVKKLLAIPLLLAVACSPLETARMLGAGTKLFRTDGKIYSQTFKKNLITCYNEVLLAIKKLEAKRWRGSFKKHFIVASNFNAVFTQCNNSTDVAVFFQYQGPDETKVEVSSLNYPLSEFASEKLFAWLNGDRNIIATNQTQAEQPETANATTSSIADIETNITGNNSGPEENLAAADPNATRSQILNDIAADTRTDNMLSDIPNEIQGNFTSEAVPIPGINTPENPASAEQTDENSTAK